jgi:mannose/cellobiose epimerase-like protein (N-acyl-D-glucosamine 2-epimerase family)
LREFFAEDWSRLDTTEGAIVEPGHMMEWSWIIYRARRLLGLGDPADAYLLFSTAERIGVDLATGLTLDQVDPDGAILSADSRSWPQTEALKANLAVLENDGIDTRERIASCVDNLLDRYLAHQPAGTWIDHLDAAGQPRVDKIPSSTFYHIFLAFSELLRLQHRIEAFRPA